MINDDLEVHLRVPVGVKEDDDVGGVEVDAQAAGPRGQQEDELLAPLRVEVVDLRLPVLPARVACVQVGVSLGILEVMDMSCYRGF